MYRKTTTKSKSLSIKHAQAFCYSAKASVTERRDTLRFIQSVYSAKVVDFGEGKVYGSPVLMAKVGTSGKYRYYRTQFV